METKTAAALQKMIDLNGPLIDAAFKELKTCGCREAIDRGIDMQLDLLARRDFLGLFICQLGVQAMAMHLRERERTGA